VKSAALKALDRLVQHANLVVQRRRLEEEPAAVEDFLARFVQLRRRNELGVHVVG